VFERVRSENERKRERGREGGMERKSSAANIFSPQLIASLIFPLGGKNGLSQLRRLLNLISQKKI